MKQMGHDLIIIENEFGFVGFIRLFFLPCVCLKFSITNPLLKNPPPFNISQCPLQSILLSHTI